MKNISNSKIILFLAILLTSCNGFISTPAMSPTDVTETAISTIKTALAETQLAIPMATFTATLIPSSSPLPHTETSAPIKISIPMSGTPTVIAIENGLTWTECIVPSFNHPRESANFEFATTCLNLNWPGWDDYDVELNGQRLREERLPGEMGDTLRLVIGKDIYETRYTLSNAHDYELLKNGVVIAKASAYLISFDPNIKLWNIGGKSVWEIYSEPPAIIVDGINLTEKHQLEGSFFPYDIKNKLIYIARKNGKYNIVYDEKAIGSEFGEIYVTLLRINNCALRA